MAGASLSPDVSQACASFASAAVLEQSPPSWLLALGPLLLGGLCGNLPANLPAMARPLHVLDSSESLPMAERHSDSILLVPAGHSCVGCVQVAGCIEIATITALALLLLELGAHAVFYSHLPVAAGIPAMTKCRSSAGVRALYAPAGSQTTLRYWLRGAFIAMKRCSGGKRGKRPTQAMVEVHSDKCKWNSYTRLYDQLLPSRQCAFTNILEIGIGTRTKMVPHLGTAYMPGASLRGWRAVFPLANVTGLDLDAGAVLEARSRRIHTHICNSVNRTRVRELFHKDERFDMIVDDGAHEHRAQVRTWRNLWRYVRGGGIYVIEDVFQAEGAERMTARISGSVAITMRSTDMWVVFVTK